MQLTNYQAFASSRFRFSALLQESGRGPLAPFAADAPIVRRRRTTSINHFQAEPAMLDVSTRSLKILAALTWLAGVLVLVVKAGSLLAEAYALRSEQHWPWLAIVAGLLLGVVQARRIFNESCQKNLDRIDTLEQPKPWQFFTTRFYLMLLVMILAGAALSRLAHGSYPFLLVVVVLDLGIAAALLISGRIYWNHGASSNAA